MDEHDPERGDAPSQLTPRGDGFGDPRVPHGQGVPARGRWQRGAEAAKEKSEPTERTGLLSSVRGSMDDAAQSTVGAMTAAGGVFTGDIASTVDLLTDQTTVTTYDPMLVAGWEALFIYRGTIFAQKAMWTIVAMQLLLMFAIAIYVLVDVKDPHLYKTDTVSQVVKTVAAFIGFLLGLFLSSCLNRWWDTVKAIEALFGVSKKLVVYANSISMERTERDMISRRVVLSTRIIDAELAFTDATNWRKVFSKLREDKFLTAAEEEHLTTIPADQRSFFTWTLMSKQLQRLQKSFDPIVFDRLSDLLLEGLSAVSALKNLMSFQFPFLYMHMLAFMVHLANFLTAIGTGITLGLLLARGRVEGEVSRDHISNTVTIEPFQEMMSHVDPGALGENILFFLLQTFFYQAALTIGASLSYPIGSPGAKYMYRMPLDKMVAQLDKHLQMINLTADSKKIG
jgi:predicted membrane chloride channel (bestrophin family)